MRYRDNAPLNSPTGLTKHEAFKPHDWITRHKAIIEKYTRDFVGSGKLTGAVRLEIAKHIVDDNLSHRPKDDQDKVRNLLVNLYIKAPEPQDSDKMASLAEAVRLLDGEFEGDDFSWNQVKNMGKKTLAAAQLAARLYTGGVPSDIAAKHRDEITVIEDERRRQRDMDIERRSASMGAVATCVEIA